jgi:hypothetical protein
MIFEEKHFTAFRKNNKYRSVYTISISKAFTQILKMSVTNFKIIQENKMLLSEADFLSNHLLFHVLLNNIQ